MAKESKRRLFLTLSLCIAAFGLASVVMAEEEVEGQVANVGGEVTLTAADGATFPAAGVRLILNCESQPVPRVEISDERGAFRFESVRADGCTIVTDLQGFSSASATIKAGEAAGLRFHLEVEPIFTSLTVTGKASADVPIRRHGRTVGSAHGKSGR